MKSISTKSAVDSLSHHWILIWVVAAAKFLDKCSLAAKKPLKESLKRFCSIQTHILCRKNSEKHKWKNPKLKNPQMRKSKKFKKKCSRARGIMVFKTFATNSPHCITNQIAKKKEWKNENENFEKPQMKKAFSNVKRENVKKFQMILSKTQKWRHRQIRQKQYEVKI